MNYSGTASEYILNKVDNFLKCKLDCLLLHVRKKIRQKQEVGGNLRVCILNLLLKVSFMPSLAAKIIVKMEMQICHNTSCWSRDQELCDFKGSSFSTKCLLQREI